MDKDRLLSNRLATRYVDVDDGKIVVRALSRAQALHLRTVRDDQAELETLLLVYGLAEPALDRDEAAAYLGVAGVDEVAAVIEAIKELSGLAEGAPKSGVPGA